MNKRPFKLHSLAFAAFTAATLALAPLSAHADEREDLEKLRATLLSLIDTLVKSGVLPRDRADGMMREAQRRANEQLAQLPPPEVGADGKKIVRVPYVPESVRVQMREQIKTEVLAQTRAESAGAEAAAGGGRVKLEGDLRLRGESVRPASDNTLARDYSAGNPDVTRAPDFWANTAANTREALERTRLRARVGMEVAISDEVKGGLSLSTGSSTASPTSTNQTMATGASSSPGFFNKYSLVIDRAFLRYQPTSWLSLSGGRFANPFLSTDLVWADDLNFEGFAVAAKTPAWRGASTFVTAGWFPLAFTSPGQTVHRDLLALQAGAEWQFGLKENRLKLAGALYSYSGIEGIKETATDPKSVPGYVTRSEYGSGYRQRGNTLFRINTNPVFDNATNWGLASSFRELDFTLVADIAQFDPLHLVLTGDFVYNLGFDRAEIERRTGLRVSDGSAYGYLLRLQAGAPAIKRFGDWNVSLAYRRLGSDAVLDAFTNSDFGLGGTNNKGFILGANFGVAKNSWLSARWLSARNLDSAVPVVRSGSKSTKLSVDTLQFDFNARF